MPAIVDPQINLTLLTVSRSKENSNHIAQDIDKMAYPQILLFSSLLLESARMNGVLSFSFSGLPRYKFLNWDSHGHSPVFLLAEVWKLRCAAA